MRSNIFDSKKDCCGCEACVNICPKGLITMQSDEEGFLYPVIENMMECIECNQCKMVCPIKNVEKTKNFLEIAYAGYVNNEIELLSSSSGGIATAISKAFIEKFQGVVFGVRYSTNFKKTEYVCVDTNEGLEQLKGSKYSQSEKNDVYNSVVKQLEKGKKVLFIGLPCDVYALLRFCKNQDNLYVCTLICHGVTSPKVLVEYLDSMLEVNKKITKFSLRYKKMGWKPYYIFTELDEKEKIYEQFNTSMFGNAFLYLKRPSCNNCKIKRNTIHSDVTLGDFHNIVNTDHYYNKNGVSSIIIHNEKGKQLLDIVDGVTLESVDVNKVIRNRGYYEAIPEKKNRKEYAEVFSKAGLKIASNLKSCKKIENYEKNKKRIMMFLAKIKNIVHKIIKSK